MKNLDFVDKLLIENAVNGLIRFYTPSLAQYDVNHPVHKYAQSRIDECLRVLDKLYD